MAPGSGAATKLIKKRRQSAVYRQISSGSVIGKVIHVAALSMGRCTKTFGTEIDRLILVCERTCGRIGNRYILEVIGISDKHFGLRHSGESVV